MSDALLRLKALPVQLFHRCLLRTQENTAYKSECPFCGVGMLPVRRLETTLVLVRNDWCTHCAQRVVYRDSHINGEPFGEGD